ncbi:hypothetical protein SeMB42_g07971 [Synchytrium endobioticum]|uniref:glutathione-specific gamma-glutamylcyclotransferase n=1 Tax=Synchytrium endobioticum TaxID=286115 RepID=A0A507BRE8_9FUNG|nr:hypothetical protein SeMB42_g07971 [Synchytrium endobioticum]TPX45842.1 hypothetical protein SeLEV6574_g03603 [Synchytrium endobioticum]
MYIFGYGSLIWKVDFPFEFKTSGYVKGFKRRFWQGSIDHRGTPEAPGRVVTLIPTNEWQQKYAHLDDTHDDEDVVYGIVFKIADQDVDKVKAHLDFREQNGYSCYTVPVYHPSVHDGESPLFNQVLVYVADSDNESFVGPAPLAEMAQDIAVRSGPSGPNKDYLFGLCDSLRLVGGLDRHLRELELAVEQHVLGIGDARRIVVSEKDAQDMRTLARALEKSIELPSFLGKGLQQSNHHLKLMLLRPLLVMARS